MNIVTWAMQLLEFLADRARSAAKFSPAPKAVFWELVGALSIVIYIFADRVRNLFLSILIERKKDAEHDYERDSERTVFGTVLVCATVCWWQRMLS